MEYFVVGGRFLDKIVMWRLDVELLTLAEVMEAAKCEFPETPLDRLELEDWTTAAGEQKMISLSKKRVR